MTLDFSTLLDVDGDDVKAPKPLPQGYYYVRATKPHEVHEGTTRNGDPYQRFAFTFTVEGVANDSVMEDELEEFGDPHGFPVTQSIMIMDAEDDDEGAKARRVARFQSELKKLAEAFGATSGPLNKRLADMLNNRAIAQIVHANNPDNPDAPYINIKRLIADE